MTGQAEEEACKNYVENGKQSFREILNYTDVGNRKNSVYFLPMLISNWNGSFQEVKLLYKRQKVFFKALNEENKLQLVVKEMAQESETY